MRSRSVLARGLRARGAQHLGAPSAPKFPNRNTYAPGTYLSKAKTAISEAGLQVGEIRHAEHAELGQNYVLRQSPAEDTEVAPGTKVDLVVVAPN